METLLARLEQEAATGRVSVDLDKEVRAVHMHANVAASPPSLPWTPVVRKMLE